MTSLKKILLFGVVASLIMAGSANALPYSFFKITDNGNPDVASQLVVYVTANGARVDFKFTNNVGTASSITDIYFDDGSLLGIVDITTSGNGPAFNDPASPGNLSGGNLASPPFVATEGFSADSDSPVSQNGINAANEWVTITFDLINGKTYADTLAALADGSLRIGLHVQAIGTLSGSDSYINNGTVPDGGMTLMLLGGALVGLGALRRKFRA